MLIKDRDKGISRITYNNIGLVDSILFDNGAKVVYTYAMNGEKLRVRHHAALPSVVRPLHAPVGGGIFPGTPLPVILYDEDSYYGGDIVKKSSVGNRNVYTVPSYRYYFGGGYMEWEAPDVMVGAQITMEPDFYYYTKDHLGNVRSVVKADSDGPTEVQQTHYYPFGGIIADLSSGRDVQNRLYNGKELDTSNNLFWLDYGARQYDPTRGQFTNYDQHCESYYNTNPLTYCGNNPISRIDPTGMDWYKQVGENGGICYAWQEGSDDVDGWENIGANFSLQYEWGAINFSQGVCKNITYIDGYVDEIAGPHDLLLTDFINTIVSGASTAMKSLGEKATIGDNWKFYNNFNGNQYVKTTYLSPYLKGTSIGTNSVAFISGAISCYSAFVEEGEIGPCTIQAGTNAIVTWAGAETGARLFGSIGNTLYPGWGCVIGGIGGAIIGGFVGKNGMEWLNKIIYPNNETLF